MPRLIATIATVALTLGLFGCAPSRAPGPDPDALARRLQTSVLRVEGVSGGEVRVVASGPVREPKVICDLTSGATSRDALVAAMERVLRAVIADTRDVGNGLVQCAVGNGSVKVKHSDVVPGSGDVVTLERLRSALA